MSLKVQRISSDILRELSKIMMVEAKDEIFKSITLTSVEVTNDLSFARVYFTYMGDLNKDDVLKKLNEAKSYLRTVLASKIEVRHTPELMFIYDNSIEYGQNIERIINEIHKKEN